MKVYNDTHVISDTHLSRLCGLIVTDRAGSDPRDFTWFGKTLKTIINDSRLLVTYCKTLDYPHEQLRDTMGIPMIKMGGVENQSLLKGKDVKIPDQETLRQICLCHGPIGDSIDLLATRFMYSLFIQNNFGESTWYLERFCINLDVNHYQYSENFLTIGELFTLAKVYYKVLEDKLIYFASGASSILRDSTVVAL